MTILIAVRNITSVLKTPIVALLAQVNVSIGKRLIWI